jgi:hypothetical protein
VGCVGQEGLQCPVARASSIQHPSSSHCSSGVHPNFKIEVCVKISGVVIGRNSCAGDTQVVVHGLLAAKSHMKVVKSIKMKPHEVAPMEMSLIRVMHWRLQWLELSYCMLLRKSELHRLQLMHQRAHRSSSCLGFLLMSVGRSRCRE